MSEIELAELAGTAMSNFLTSFTVFVSIGLLSVFIFRVFLSRTQALAQLNNPDIGVDVIVDVTWAVAILYVILVCGSLVFMRYVRQPNANK